MAKEMGEVCALTTFKKIKDAYDQQRYRNVNRAGLCGLYIQSIFADNTLKTIVHCSDFCITSSWSISKCTVMRTETRVKINYPPVPQLIFF